MEIINIRIQCFSNFTIQQSVRTPSINFGRISHRISPDFHCLNIIDAKVLNQSLNKE